MSRLGTFSLPAVPFTGACPAQAHKRDHDDHDLDHFSGLHDAVPFTGACPAQAHKGDHDDHDLDHFCGLHDEDDTNAEVGGVSIYFTSSKQRS